MSINTPSRYVQDTQQSINPSQAEFDRLITRNTATATVSVSDERALFAARMLNIILCTLRAGR